MTRMTRITRKKKKGSEIVVVSREGRWGLGLGNHRIAYSHRLSEEKVVEFGIGLGGPKVSRYVVLWLFLCQIIKDAAGDVS